MKITQKPSLNFRFHENVPPTEVSSTALKPLRPLERNLPNLISAGVKMPEWGGGGGGGD